RQLDHLRQSLGDTWADGAHPLSLGVELPVPLFLLLLLRARSTARHLAECTGTPREQAVHSARSRALDVERAQRSAWAVDGEGAQRSACCSMKTRSACSSSAISVTCCGASS